MESKKILSTSVTATTNVSPSSTSSPCGACKFLRRKCVAGCVFAPHFASEQGPARFAAVHKVFGASNVSKLLVHVPPGRRNDAVVTICYEAQARLSDPVYGCVSTILALQQQVASLQAELSIVQSQLINSKLVHQTQQITALQPAYSNSSATSINIANGSGSGFPSVASLDLGNPGLPSRVVEPLQDEEEESQELVVFSNNGVFHPK